MTERGPRAVVDTNLFVSGTIFTRGHPHALLEAWRAGAFVLLLSDDHYDELTDVLSRPKIVRRYRITPADLSALFAGLATAERVTPSPVLPVQPRDPKDAKILAAAVGGNADYLVSGDDDLLVLAGDPHLKPMSIVTVVEFLTILGGRGWDVDEPG
jgi:putative PIN family toxin of toxin-antitoxin system